MNIVENEQIRRLYKDLKEYEKDFGSISPKMIEIRNNLKTKITETQLKINEIRNKKNIPL